MLGEESAFTARGGDALCGFEREAADAVEAEANGPQGGGALRRVVQTFEHRLDLAQLHVHRPHLDAVRARVAHQLRRRVEPSGWLFKSAARKTSGWWR